MNKNPSIMCPAHRCMLGSRLLGIRQNDGTISILPQPLAISEAFIEKTKQQSIAPERKFRFTNKCIENGCKQWNNQSCGIAEKMVTYLNDITSSAKLPVCEIRPNCRWFIQQGENACRICPLVPTEIAAEEI